MRHKIQHKKSKLDSRNSHRRIPISYTSHLVIILSVLCLIFAGVVAMKFTNEQRVLGENIYLAKGGEKKDVHAQENKPQETKRPEEKKELQKPELKQISPKIEKKEIETEVEGSKAKIKLQEGDSKIRIEASEAGIKVKTKKNDGTEVELKKKTIETLNETLDTDLSVGTEGGEVVVKKGGVRTRTHFPISIDVDTNQLLITTKKGTKAVAVLPDQAIQNMIQKGHFDSIVHSASGSGVPAEGSGSAQQDEQTSDVELTELNDQPVYKMKGKKAKKFLGIVPIEIEKTAYVSTETGDVVQEEQGIVSTLLDAVSF